MLLAQTRVGFVSLCVWLRNEAVFILHCAPSVSLRVWMWKQIFLYLCLALFFPLSLWCYIFQLLNRRWYKDVNSQTAVAVRLTHFSAFSRVLSEADLDLLLILSFVKTSSDETDVTLLTALKIHSSSDATCDVLLRCYLIPGQPSPQPHVRWRKLFHCRIKWVPAQLGHSLGFLHPKHEYRTVTTTYSSKTYIHIGATFASVFICLCNLSGSVSACKTMWLQHVYMCNWLCVCYSGP